MPSAIASISLAFCLASCLAPAAEGSEFVGGRGQVSPVEKVVTLLENLIAEVETDGGKEASGYKDFACFCKSKSTELSDEILSTQDVINQLSAEIEEKTALKAADEDKLVEEKAKLEKLKADLESTEAENSKAKAAYEASDADLVKAISSCAGAVEALEKSKPAAAGSAAAAGLVTVKANIQKNLALADALKIIDDGPKWQQVSALLQDSTKVNPDDPDYKFHSKQIMEVISDLQKKFEAQKDEADLEESARVKMYKETVESLTKEIVLTEDSITALEEEIAQFTEDIATARHSLVESESTMKDAKLYLTDLTESCEKRAKDWDQRTAVRFDELANLKKALALLTDVVMEKSEVNKRALLIATKTRNRNSSVKTAANRSIEAPAPPSFLQEAARLVTVHRMNSSESLDSQDREVRKGKALDLLRMEGARLGSAALAALATRAVTDPFLKVKGLIQKLIERLVHEATEEATKKGFCDTELAKNEKDRVYRMQDVMKLNSELEVLEAKRDFLENEITELKAALEVLYKDLAEATETREKEKAANLATIATAKEGAVALKEAMLILHTFYGEAAKTSENLGKYAQLQTKDKKYSPMEEDTAGAGFEGNYGGKQDAMKAIIGILDVIKSDFARTMRVTTEAEAKAHADFVIYERNAKADIASKETKVELDTNDLETTKATIEQNMMDMQTNMDLVDGACKALEALKPMCIDSGMSYEQRVAKREEEIEKLKEALCILDENGVEPGC